MRQSFTIGIGGAAGQLPVASPDHLREGYAMAGSDAGTGPRSSADFNFNPGQREDYRGRGVHVSAQATQQIARRYYQRLRPAANSQPSARSCR